MITRFALIVACLAVSKLQAASPLPPGTRLKTGSASTLTVKQVIPGKGVFAIISLNKDVHGNVSTTGEIFISCDPQGVIDGQVVKPVPPIVATAESYSYETVGMGVRTVQKYAFAR